MLPLKKICSSFINNLQSNETKNLIKAHLLYFANSYFYNCKLSSRILHKQRILWNLKKNKDVVLTKSDKGNGVVILHQELSDNEEIIQDISKFEKLDENPFLKCKASLQRFLCKLKQKKKKKTEMYMIKLSFWFCSSSYLWYS